MKEEREKNVVSSKEISNRLKSKYIVNSLNVALCCCKEPSLIDEYGIKMEDFYFTKDYAKDNVRLVFEFATYLKEYETVDWQSCQSLIEQYPKFKSYWEDGVEAINHLNSINTDNFVQYLEGFQKFNFINSVLEKDNLTLLTQLLLEKELTFEEISQKLVAEYEDITLNLNHLEGNIKCSDMIIGDEVESFINGSLIEFLSFEETCPLLNQQTNGLISDGLTILAGASGSGKSSFLFSNIIYPIVKRGEKVVIISNELSIEQYKQMAISITAFREFNTIIDRSKAKQGFYKNDKQAIETIRESVKYWDEHMAKNLIFIDYTDGKFSTIGKYIRKYARLGFKLAVYDTTKAENSADSKAWGELKNAVKKLSFLAKELKISILLPCQLQHAIVRTAVELTQNDLAESKGMVDVASTALMFRPLRGSEYTGQKFDCLAKDNQGYLIDLDKNENYIVMFVSKNREGRITTNQQILYRFDGSSCIFEEIGTCEVTPFERKKKTFESSYSEKTTREDFDEWFK